MGSFYGAVGLNAVAVCTIEVALPAVLFFRTAEQPAHPVPLTRAQESKDCQMKRLQNCHDADASKESCGPGIP
jgi:hypothetical protein